MIFSMMVVKDIILDKHIKKRILLVPIKILLKEIEWEVIQSKKHPEKNNKRKEVL